MRYGTGSLDEAASPAVAKAAAAAPQAGKVVQVSGINRAPIRGSFVVSVFANVDGERLHVDREALLSRWSVKYCANCQNQVEVLAFAGLEM